MKTDRKSRSNRKAPLIASLALACSLAAGTAGAGIPVTDVGNMPNHILNQIGTWLQKGQDIAEYGEQATRWTKEFNHYQQQLTQLSNFFQVRALTANTIKKKQADEGIAERCNGSSGNIFSDLFSAAGISLGGDIAAQQKRVCAQIVTLENAKFNEQVQLLDDLVNKTQADIKTLQSNMGANKDQGALAANEAQAQKMIAQIQLESQNAETRIKVYDGMISSLKEDQKSLASAALNGKSSILGSLVDTAMLAGALTAAKSL
jgi:hypothetical protein